MLSCQVHLDLKRIMIGRKFHHMSQSENNHKVLSISVPPLTRGETQQPIDSHCNAISIPFSFHQQTPNFSL